MISDRLGKPGLLGCTADEWFSPCRFAALLALLFITCFPQVIFGLEAFAYGDAAQFAYPVAFHLRESFWRGELPLWNPLSSCGIPFLAQWNTLALYPGSLIYILLPLPWSFGLFCLLHLFLGGMGMYFLAHSWTGNRLASAVAGAVFAFNGLTWYALMWPHLISALAWMPFVLLTMQQAWHEARARRQIAIAAVPAALQLLTGGAEVILQTWIILGVVLVVRLLAREMPAGRLLLRLLLVSSLAAGIAAAQLLPFLDLLSCSQRTAGYATGGMGAIAAMPLTGWLNYVVPLFGAVRNFNGVFVQAGQSWVGSYYLGIGTVALAALAVWQVRTRPSWTLMGLALFGLLLALGSRGVFYDIARRLLPLLGFIRFPIKFVFLPAFALPMLAALGVNWFLTAPAGPWLRARRAGVILVLALLGLSCAAVAWSWKQPLDPASPGLVAGNAAVRALFLLLLALCLVMLRVRTVLRAQRALQTALIALLWFDVYTHSSNLSPTVPAAVLQPDAIRQFFKWQDVPASGLSRAMESRDSLWKVLSTGSANLEQDTTARRLALFMDLNLLDHVPKMDGFYSMDLKEYLEIFKRLYFGTNEASALKDFLGVSRISNPTNALDWVPRNSALPMLTAGQQPVFASPPEALNGIFSAGFDPLRTVYLPHEAQEAAPATGAAAQVVSPRFSANRIEFQVHAEAPSVVVISQCYHHHWQAYVDGKPTPLWRANYAFQALRVPPGTHSVTLRYDDLAFRLGAAVSALALLACGVLWWPRRRTN